MKSISICQTQLTAASLKFDHCQPVFSAEKLDIFVTLSLVFTSGKVSKLPCGNN